MRVAAQVHAREASARQRVVVGEFLTLPKHRNPLRREKRDSEWLQLVEPAAVTLGERPRIAHCARKHDQLAVIVCLHVLEWRNGHLDRVARAIDDSLRCRISAKVRIQQVRKVRIRISATAPCPRTCSEARPARRSW